jgi:hypothetical protein
MLERIEPANAQMHTLSSRRRIASGFQFFPLNMGKNYNRSIRVTMEKGRFAAQSNQDQLSWGESAAGGVFYPF